jgi:carbamoyltransferase
MRPIRDAGKTMGLASYGDPEAVAETFSKMSSFNSSGDIEFDLKFLKDGWGSKNSKAFLEAFGVPRKPEEEITQPRFANLAAAAQKVIEQGFFHLGEAVKKETGATHLCIAGGVALNSVANGKLIRSGMFEDVWIQPAANDAGLALGAAYHVYNSKLGRPRTYTMKHAFYGPGFDTETIRKALEIGKIPHREIDDPSRTAAELVAQDKIVGWFQGRQEVGPRALGNRSILANPRRADMKDIVNRYVKHREPYRPFAPSAMEDHTPDYFDIDRPNPYMLIVCDVRPEKRDEVPAITHVDGTGRLQTVSREENPLYWKLIDEFRKITGTPVVLNTSFNIRGEPIVTTPEDALKCYFTTGLDALVLDRFLVEKSPEESCS